MNSIHMTSEYEKKSLLSTLWLFVLLNIIFRDLHEFISPGFLEEAMTGHVDGTKITENLVFIGALLVEVPIAMVLLSRLLKCKLNRCMNIFASLITIAVTLSSIPVVPADIFFDVIEVTTLLVIIWIALKWTEQEEYELNQQDQ